MNCLFSGGVAGDAKKNISKCRLQNFLPSKVSAIWIKYYLFSNLHMYKPRV